MEQTNFEDIHEKLTNKIKAYISIIKKEYGKYMSPDNLQRLNNIYDYNKILNIYDYGEISAYANSNSILMPLCADKLLKAASKIPGYGIAKNHKLYNSDNVIINNNTFLTYVIHVFISGTNSEGYYDDLLLHEVMHFCGSGGASVLDEGINELLTRMIAQSYSLRTNSCGYPKEVKLAYELMNCFGKDIIINLAFIKEFDSKIKFIKDNLGEEAAELYYKVFSQAEKEFNEKYYSHMSEFSGIIGISKKILFYKKIDYSNIYLMIDDYINSKSKNRSK